MRRHAGRGGRSGILTCHLFLQQLWVGFALALFVHGSMASICGSGNHELTHGTVFRSRWLNKLFLPVYALLHRFSPYDYALSHTYQHRYTLHPDGDREVVLPAVTYPALPLCAATLDDVPGIELSQWGAK